MDTRTKKTEKVMDLCMGSIHLELILNLTTKPLTFTLYRKGRRFVDGVSYPVGYRRQIAKFSYLVEALDFISTYFKTGEHRKEP